jgi:hypothetical protein
MVLTNAVAMSVAVLISYINRCNIYINFIPTLIEGRAEEGQDGSFPLITSAQMGLDI